MVNEVAKKSNIKKNPSLVKMMNEVTQEMPNL